MLKIPSLSVLFNKLPFSSDDPSDMIPRNPVIKYDGLNDSTGDRKQINLIVQELEKYVPMCTIGYATNSNHVRQRKVLDGALTARALLKRTKKATAACEKAMYNKEEYAASIANFEAHKAPPNPNSPKDQGGRPRKPSKPTPNKHAKNKNGKGNNGKGKEATSNAQNANRSLKKHTPLQAKRPAKSQDSDPDDQQQQPPRKKQQRKPGPKTPIPPTTAAKAKATNTSSKTAFENRRGNRGGANRQNKRNRKPS
jgi:hypothetical protein